MIIPFFIVLIAVPLFAFSFTYEHAVTSVGFGIVYFFYFIITTILTFIGADLERGNDILPDFVSYP
jgi:lipopolysaccharide export LptBFGC system permease protein LptF